MSGLVAARGGMGRRQARGQCRGQGGFTERHAHGGMSLLLEEAYYYTSALAADVSNTLNMLVGTSYMASTGNSTASRVTDAMPWLFRCHRLMCCTAPL